AQVRTDLMTQVIQPWRFTSPEPKLMVHIRDRAPSGELLGLMMHDARDPKATVTYLAEHGLIIKQAGMAYLRMENGHIVRRLESDPTPQIIAFERYAVDLNQLEQRVDQGTSLRPRERTTPELLWPDPEDALYKQSPARFASELHDRMASPLYAFAFVLLVVAALGHAQTTRQNRNQAAVIAFALAIGCRIGGILAAPPAPGNLRARPPLFWGARRTGLFVVVGIPLRVHPRGPWGLAQLLARLGHRGVSELPGLGRSAAVAAPRGRG